MSRPSLILIVTQEQILNTDALWSFFNRWGGPLREVVGSDGSGSKSFDLGLVGPIFCGLGRVSHLWFEFGFGKFSLKMSNFSIFPLDQKNLFR